MPAVAAAPAAADQCGRHHALILRRPVPSSNRITPLFHALALGSGGTLQGLDLLLEGGLLLVRGLQLVPEPCTPSHLLLMASLLRGEETLEALNLAAERGGLAVVGDSSLLGGGDLLRTTAMRWTWIRGRYGSGLHLGVDLEFDVDAEEDVLSGEVGHRELSNEHRAMRGGGTISFGFRPGVLQVGANAARLVLFGGSIGQSTADTTTTTRGSSASMRREGGPRRRRPKSGSRRRRTSGATRLLLIR
jgi:hypothetical protein